MGCPAGRWLGWAGLGRIGVLHGQYSSVKFRVDETRVCWHYIIISHHGAYFHVENAHGTIVVEIKPAEFVLTACLCLSPCFLPVSWLTHVRYEILG